MEGMKSARTEKNLVLAIQTDTEKPRNNKEHENSKEKARNKLKCKEIVSSIHVISA